MKEFDALADQIGELCQRTHVPGVSIAVVRNGVTAWSGAFGTRRQDSGEPVRTDTI